jgi:hypothetical protein
MPINRQKQNAMIEKAGKKNHREDEPITKIQIGSSSRFMLLSSLRNYCDFGATFTARSLPS